MRTRGQDNNKSTNKFPYLKYLTNNEPTNSEDYEVDASILHEQIDHKHVGNVAIVAQYGAGKSTMINTYLHDYRGYSAENNIEKPQKNHYARVSLATFNNDKYDEIGIERSILQQLLYSVNGNKLPKSKIERTDKTPISNMILECLLTFLIIGCVVIFSLFMSGNMPWMMEFGNLQWLYLGLGLLGIVMMLFYLIYYRKIKHFKYKDLEADFSIDSGSQQVQVKNLINKFIDEVLYYFECSNINLVIFEDLDRLGKTEIFAKLRELNTIINNSNKCKGKVTFLYAVKDDLFELAEDRAKFFDFILPVVPVINPVTAQNTINNIFDAIETKEVKIKPEFVQDISIYVPNMRVLNNTINDYLIMYAKIFEDEKVSSFLKKEKLFALCLYKNLYPYDYALLEQNNGLIPLFIDMHGLREKVIINIDDQIKENNENIATIISNANKEFYDLKQSLRSQHMAIRWGNRQYCSPMAIDISDIKSFAGLKLSDIRRPDNASYSLLYDSNDIEPIATDNESYYSKERKIKEVAAKKINDLREINSELTKQIYSIYSMSFDELIKFDVIAKEFTEETIIKKYKEWRDGNQVSSTTNKQEDNISVNNENKYKEQVQYFIYMAMNGYIDEHYIEYTSNYKSDSFAPADVALVKSIKNNVIDYNANVENVDRVIERLNVDDFKKESILIKQIVDNIFNFSDRNTLKKENLVCLLTNVYNKKVLLFLEDYIKATEKSFVYQLVNILLGADITTFSNLLKTDATEKLKNVFAVGAIQYGKNYKLMNADNMITDYLNDNENCWDIFNNVANNNKVKTAIEEWNLVLYDISGENNIEEIYNHVIDNNHYTINLNNIVTALHCSNENKSFYSAPYTYLMNANKQSVIDYVTNNINTFISNVMFNKNITLENEDPQNIYSLTHNNDVNEEFKIELIKNYSKPHIGDISKEPEVEYNDLFKFNAVKPTWYNIQYAYAKQGFDCIKSYFTSDEIVVEGDYTPIEGISLDTQKRLYNSILLGLDSDSLTKILPDINIKINMSELSNDKLTDDILLIAINASHINYNSGDFVYLSNKPQSLNLYVSIYEDNIEKEFDTFFSMVLPYDHGCYRPPRYTAKTNAQKNIATILNCNDINVQMKNNLLNECDEIIQIEGHEKIYAKYVLNEKQLISLNILWQFTNIDNTIVDEESKLAIFNINAKQIESGQYKKEIEEYLTSINPKMKGVITGDNVFKIDTPNENIVSLTKILKDKDILGVIKHRTSNAITLHKAK